MSDLAVYLIGTMCILTLMFAGFHILNLERVKVILGWFGLTFEAERSPSQQQSTKDSEDRPTAQSVTNDPVGTGVRSTTTEAENVIGKAIGENKVGVESEDIIADMVQGTGMNGGEGVVAKNGIRAKTVIGIAVNDR